MSSSFDLQDLGFDEPPPRPETPPVRKGFVLILCVLCFAALLVYGIPYVADRTGYAWEAGRSRAASEALAKLDREGIVIRALELFRMATTAVSPAVVNVQSFREKQGSGDLAQGNPLGGNEFSNNLQSRELGSGVIINKEKGYVVTNYHVVKEADQIVVQLGPGDEVRARLVGADAKTDLAVLQVRSSLPVQADWGDSDKLDIGDWVLAIGSPLGFDHSVTAGIVSATERSDVMIADYESFIQTDAAINPEIRADPSSTCPARLSGSTPRSSHRVEDTRGLASPYPPAGPSGGRQPDQGWPGRSRIPWGYAQTTGHEVSSAAQAQRQSRSGRCGSAAPKPSGAGGLAEKRCAHEDCRP